MFEDSKEDKRIEYVMVERKYGSLLWKMRMTHNAYPY